jgi:sugar phosphate isomerase/epimerase
VIPNTGALAPIELLEIEAMKCKNWPVAVCSWSLRTDVAGVAAAMEEVGIEHVHLGIRAAVEDGSGKVLDTIKAQKWTITSTMIDFPQEDYSTLDTIKVTGGVVPDEHWNRNRGLFQGAAQITAKLGVKYLSMHAGFVDESKPAYAEKVAARIRTLADIAKDSGLTLLLETGQETATELRHFLEKLDHKSVGVNFDPANMILYDKGDPIEAVRVLAPWIRHLHVKDALRTTKPGTWGSEVPWGDGQVGVERFLAVLGEVGFKGAMAIEREAGDNRLGDIKLAAQRLKAASK